MPDHERHFDEIQGSERDAFFSEISPRLVTPLDPDSTRVSREELSFYRGLDLYKVETSEKRCAYLLYGSADLRPLDWTSWPIHKVNEKHLCLQDDNIIDYLCFFCWAIAGDSGRFFLIDEASDLEPTQPLSPDLEAILTDQVAPLERMERPADAPEGSYYFRGTVRFGDAVFGADFRVQLDGEVEMIDDRPIAANLPLVPDDLSSERFFVLSLKSGGSVSSETAPVTAAEVPAPAVDQDVWNCRDFAEALSKWMEDPQSSQPPKGRVIPSDEDGECEIDLQGRRCVRSIDLSDCTFECLVDLDELTCEGSLRLDRSRFERGLKIHNARIRGSLSLEKAYFKAPLERGLDLDSSHVDGGISGEGLRIQGDAYLSNTRIGSVIRLGGAEIDGDLLAESCHVHGWLLLTGSPRTRDIFLGSASFDAGIHMKGLSARTVDLRATVKDALVVEDCDIKGDIDASTSCFHSSVVLRGSSLSGDLDLSGSKISGSLFCIISEAGRRCDIAGYLRLIEATVHQDVDLDGIRVGRLVYVRGANTGKFSLAPGLTWRQGEEGPQFTFAEVGGICGANLTVGGDFDLTAIQVCLSDEDRKREQSGKVSDLGLGSIGLRNLTVTGALIFWNEAWIKNVLVDTKATGLPTALAVTVLPDGQQQEGQIASRVERNLELPGANIGGRFDFSNLILGRSVDSDQGAEGGVLDLADATVRRDVLCRCVHPEAALRAQVVRLRLRSLKCLGDVDLSGLCVVGPSKPDAEPTVEASGAKISGSLLLAGKDKAVVTNICGQLCLSASEVSLLRISGDCFSETCRGQRADPRPDLARTLRLLRAEHRRLRILAEGASAALLLGMFSLFLAFDYSPSIGWVGIAAPVIALYTSCRRTVHAFHAVHPREDENRWVGDEDGARWKEPADVSDPSSGTDHLHFLRLQYNLRDWLQFLTFNRRGTSEAASAQEPEVTFDRALIGHFELLKPIPRVIDLSNLTVKRWTVDDTEDVDFEELLGHTSEFKRGIYTSIEQMLRNRGDRAKADEVHRAMREQERWRDRRWLSTGLLMAHSLIGYGTRRGPAVGAMLLWFAFSVAWLATEYPDRVQLTPEIEAEYRGSLADLGRTEPAGDWFGVQTCRPDGAARSLGCSFALALRYHVPLIGPDLVPFLQPASGVMWSYLTFVLVAHWILVPVLIASLLPLLMPRQE